MKEPFFRVVSEAKAALTRIGGYTGLITLILVFLLWVDKAWDAVNGTLHRIPYAAFLAASILTLVVFLAILAVIDRRLVWPRENEVNYRVSPMTPVYALLAAQACRDAPPETVDAFRGVMRRIGAEGVFNQCLEVTRE